MKKFIFTGSFFLLIHCCCTGQESGTVLRMASSATDTVSAITSDPAANPEVVSNNGVKDPANGDILSRMSTGSTDDSEIVIVPSTPDPSSPGSVKSCTSNSENVDNSGTPKTRKKSKKP